MQALRRLFFNRRGLWLLLALSVLLEPIPSVAAITRAGGTSTPSRVGQITEYPLPKGYGEPWAITTGPDGNLWFTVDGPGHAGQNYVGRLNPHTGQITTYAIPGASGPPPTGIVSGPDGNIWAMGDGGSLELARINPWTGRMKVYSWQFNYPGLALTVGPDDNLWLLEDVGNNTIDRFSLTDHTLTQYPIPTQNALATSLITGPDGNLWFTELDGNKIGRLNPKTGQITEYPLPYQGEGPETITAGPRGDSHLWFVVNEGRFGWIDPLSGHITQMLTPPIGPSSAGLSAGPDGNLWFGEGTDGHPCYLIRTIPSTSMLFSIYHIPTLGGLAQAITTGPDGNMWFTEMYNRNHFGNKIGRITTH